MTNIDKDMILPPEGAFQERKSFLEEIEMFSLNVTALPIVSVPVLVWCWFDLSPYLWVPLIPAGSFAQKPHNNIF